LRQNNHDVMEARELSPDPGDAVLLRLAAEQARVLITIDTDFGALVFLGGAKHAGIVRLPDVPASRRVALMHQMLMQHGEEELSGAIVTVTGTRIRFSRKK
jgi:predicted nuclease of predicted toxin-antitoxin system